MIPSGVAFLPLEQWMQKPEHGDQGEDKDPTGQVEEEADLQGMQVYHW
jgi:hypothetical protein